MAAVVLMSGCGDETPASQSGAEPTATVTTSRPAGTVGTQRDSCATADLEGAAADEVRSLQRQVDSNIDEVISTEEYEQMLERFADAVAQVLDGTCEQDLEANCSAVEIECRVYVRDGVEIGGTDDEVRDRFDVAVADGIVNVIP